MIKEVREWLDQKHVINFFRLSFQTRSASRTATDCDSDDDEPLTYSPMQFDERSTHGESTKSEPVAAPDQAVLLDSDVRTKSDERQADHHEPTDAEHPCPPENDQDTPPVSVPEELESEEQGSEMEEAALEQDPRLSRPSVLIVQYECLPITHWDSRPSMVSRQLHNLYLGRPILLCNHLG